MKEVEIIKLIKTTLTVKGKGEKGDPIRNIIEFWDLRGNKLFEIDTYTNEVIYYNPDPDSSVKIKYETTRKNISGLL